MDLHRQGGAQRLWHTHQRVEDGVLYLRSPGPAFMNNVILQFETATWESSKGYQARAQKALVAGLSIRGSCVENFRQRSLIGQRDVGGFGCANASTHTAKIIEAPCTKGKSLNHVNSFLATWHKENGTAPIQGYRD